MNRVNPLRFAAALAVITFASATGSAVNARPLESPLALTVNDRPMSRSATAAVERHGIAYVKLAEIVRTFSGLMTSSNGKTSATIGSHEAMFRANDARTRVDGSTFTMPEAAFRERGDLYVPLAFFVRNVVPKASLRIDAANDSANLHVPMPQLPAAPSAKGATSP